VHSLPEGLKWVPNERAFHSLLVAPVGTESAQSPLSAQRGDAMVFKSFPIILLAVATASWADEIVIDHNPVVCMLAGKYPEIEARLLPPGAGTARVHFRAANTPYWSSVAMKAEGDVLRAALPKPSSSSRDLYYYIAATNPSLGATRSPDYLVAVVAKANVCPDPTRIANALDSASPVVERGPAVALTSAKGSSGKWIILGALGAGAAGAGIALAGHSAANFPNGTYRGTLDGYVQTAESAACSLTVDVNPGGPIEITVTGSGGSATFDFPPASISAPPGANCPATPSGFPALTGQFSSFNVNGPSISATTSVGSQTFSLSASVVNGALQGQILVIGGPPGFGGWTTGTVDFKADRSP
jgi:hypothetical protein